MPSTTLRTRVVSEDITNELIDDFAACQAQWGGTLETHPGRYTVSAPLPMYDLNKGPLHWYGPGVSIKYTGPPDSRMAHFNSPGNGGRKNRVTVRDIEFTQANSAGIENADLFHFTDVQAAKLIDVVARDFPRLSMFETVTSWTELVRMDRVDSSCVMAVDLQVHGGRKSFARFRLSNLTLSGGRPGEPLINLGLGVGLYNGFIRDVTGNFKSGGVEVLRINDGNFGNLLLDGIWQFETNDNGGGGSCIFRLMPGARSKPKWKGLAWASPGNHVYFEDKAIWP